MVVPINFPDDGARAKTPTAPEIPMLNIPPHRKMEEEGVHFKVGEDGYDIFVRGVILTVGFLAQFIRRKNHLMSNGTFTLKEVGKEGFEMLIKHLEGADIRFTSVQQAIIGLNTGFYTECPSLCRLAINYLDLNLAPQNVLDILKAVIPLDQQMRFLYKWDSGFFLDPGVEHRLEIKSLIFALVENCRIITGYCAEDLIMSKEFKDIDFELSKNILLYGMDLYIQNELILFNIIKNWCKRDFPTLTPKEKREKIGEETLFLVRYGLMNEYEFLCSIESQLFREEEIEKISKYIKNNKAVRFEGKMKLLNKPRIRHNIQPFDLSLRTFGGCSHLCPDRQKCKNIADKTKPKKEDKDPPKFVLKLLRCWQVVFD